MEINVTRSSMPVFEEYCEEIRKIWDSHWMTNMGVEHQLLQRELEKYNVIVNALLWDTSRRDHVIYRKDLKRLQPNALIIDISCDRHGGIETSEPTTIENPTYIVDSITHYAVDHTPALFWKTTSNSLSKVFVRFIDELIEDQPGNVLRQALIIDNGVILDHRIIQFQGR